MKSAIEDCVLPNESPELLAVDGYTHPLALRILGRSGDTYGKVPSAEVDF